MINESLDKIKKLYKENYSRQLSDDEAKEELSLVLFENAILQAQVFSNKLSTEFDMKLDKLIDSDFLENITTLSFAMIFCYMVDEYEDIKSRIIERYKKFIFDNAGMEDKKQKNEYFEFLIEKISKYIMWLSTGNFDNFANKRYESYREHFTRQIINANYIKIDDISRSDLNELIVYWISNIELSVKHFGLIS